MLHPNCFANELGSCGFQFRWVFIEKIKESDWKRANCLNCILPNYATNTTGISLITNDLNCIQFSIKNCWLSCQREIFYLPEHVLSLNLKTLYDFFSSCSRRVIHRGYKMATRTKKVSDDPGSSDLLSCQNTPIIMPKHAHSHALKNTIECDLQQTK